MPNLISQWLTRWRALRGTPRQAVGVTVEDWLERERVGKAYWIERIVQGLQDPAFAARFMTIATGQMPYTGEFNRLQAMIAVERFQRDYENLTEDEQLQVFQAAARQNPALYAAMQKEWDDLGRKPQP